MPVKATSQQWGSQLTTELSIADGNAGPTLNLSVPFYTAPPPVTAPGAPTNVAANATSPTSAQVSFTRRPTTAARRSPATRPGARARRVA